MKRYKQIAGLLIILATILAFMWYSAGHRELFSQLGHTPLHIIGLLAVLYIIFFVSLVIITRLTSRLSGATLGGEESVSLTAYSSIINFFGPLQSGPGVRLLYLKKRYRVSVKSFLLANLYYYGFFAALSTLFLFSGSRPWWQTLLAVSAVGLVSFFIIRRSADSKKTQLNLLAQLAIATLLQVVIVGLIYFVELRSLNHHISLHQALTYTGTANFALFVSLTPGAIGIRESFLLFSERLHHIAGSDVIAASVLDRGMYLLFLGGLFILASLLHANQKFAGFRERQADSSAEQQ